MSIREERSAVRRAEGPRQADDIQRAIRVNPGESELAVAVVHQLSGTTGFARTKIVAR